MKFPWVSRGRYEDMAGRIETLAAANETLLDRLLVALGGASMYPARPAATSSAAEMAEPLPSPAKAPRKPSDIAKMCTEHYARKAKEVSVLSITPLPEGAPHE